MSVHRHDATAIRPSTSRSPTRQLDDLRRRIEATRWPDQGARRGPTRRACSSPRWRRWRATGRPSTTGEVRGRAERAAAVHDRDRRRRHPLHPRPVAARGRAAAGHDARLARLGRRAARDRRPAHRPDGARRRRRGRVPPRPAVAARLRPLGRAERARLGRGPHRSRLGGADEAPRLHPLRRPGRRRRGRRDRRDEPPGARGAARRPHQPARGGARHRRPVAGGVRAGTRGARRARRIQGERLRLLPGDGHPAADDRLRAAGLTRRPGGLDARPRHGQLLQDRRRLRRRQAGRQPHPGQHPRQHHAVLADGHRGLGGPELLG